MAAYKETPIWIAPAMNTNMYENPVVQENIEKLTKLGYHFIEPKASLLACGDLGKGALADVDDIINIIDEALKQL
jgi:phosphopantothenoylcysteine decarboxylase/phosphopantothenoylcysteine decarboxylase/phosphopantothenate--cysteine ligase